MRFVRDEINSNKKDDSVSRARIAGERTFRRAAKILDQLLYDQNPREKPRARGKEQAQVPQYIAKAYKKMAKISDLMTDEDIEADLKVLRDAKKSLSSNL
jgi:hypothetical protein